MRNSGAELSDRKTSPVVKVFISGIIFLSLLGTSYYVCNIFHRKGIQDKINHMVKQVKDTPQENFSYGSLDGLPPVVRQYFMNVLPEGQKYLRFIRTRQDVFIQEAPGLGWQSVKAEEYFTSSPAPSLLWFANSSYGVLLPLKNVESFIGGKGEFNSSLLSCITVEHLTGNEADRSGVIRYLLMSVLFPTQLLPKDGLTWEAVDSLTARVVFSQNKTKASALFRFNSQGLVTEIIPDGSFTQAGSGSSGFQRKTLSLKLGSYKTFSGIRVPTYLEAGFDSAGVRITYSRTTIKEIVFTSQIQ